MFDGLRTVIEPMQLAHLSPFLRRPQGFPHTLSSHPHSLLLLQEGGHLLGKDGSFPEASSNGVASGRVYQACRSAESRHRLLSDGQRAAHWNERPFLFMDLLHLQSQVQMLQCSVQPMRDTSSLSQH